MTCATLIATSRVTVTSAEGSACGGDDPAQSRGSRRHVAASPATGAGVSVQNGLGSGTTDRHRLADVLSP
jgi:hypothetical protein